MKTTDWRPATGTEGGYWIVTRDALRKGLTDRGREMAHGYVQKHKRGAVVVRFDSYKAALAKAEELNRTRVPEDTLCSCGVPGCQGVAPPPPPPPPPPPLPPLPPQAASPMAIRSRVYSGDFRWTFPEDDSIEFDS